MAPKENVIRSICAAYDSLSGTDQRIATFILDNRTRIPSMAMREIAQGAGTSSPTISRFIKRLGYDDFNDLRMNLARNEGSQRQAESVIGKSTGSISLDRFQESLNFILSCKASELSDTVDQMDERTIRDVVDMFLNAHDIVIAGVGNTRTLADNFSFKLRHLGLRGVSLATADDAISLASSMGASDVLVVISSSGLSRRLENLAQIAVERSIPVVLITSNPNSPLIEHATKVIMSAQRDRLFAYGVPFSHNSVNFIIEVLFLFIHASSHEVREHIKRYSDPQSDYDRTLDPQSGEFIGNRP